MSNMYREEIERCKVDTTKTVFCEECGDELYEVYEMRDGGYSEIILHCYTCD